MSQLQSEREDSVIRCLIKDLPSNSILTRARGVVKVSILAGVAVLPGEIALALTFARFLMANATHRSDVVALARHTLGIVVIPVSTSFAVMSIKVGLAMTLSVLWLALVSLCAFQATIAGLAVRISVITIRTVVTVRFQVLLATLADSRLLLTVAGQIESVTVTRLTHIRLVPVASAGPVVLGRALVAVRALSVVLAIHANTATLVFAVNVQRRAVVVHLLVVATLARVAVAIASWKKNNLR